MDSSKDLECGPHGTGRELKEELRSSSHHFRVLEEDSWRYTYEALTHLHSLRLFLFNSLIPVPWGCASLEASFSSDSPISSSPVVLCQWIGPEGESHKLYVPLPVCLIDYSAPFAALARTDHFEIKLKLLSLGGTFSADLRFLGFTERGEPIGGDDGVENVAEDSLKFCLNADTELLDAKEGGVTFYCRNCVAQLTSAPIRSFLGLPSTEWRELADHWFGMCCCRDGVHTKSLMVKFEQLLKPTRGVCLVGSNTCNIHSADLVSNFMEKMQLSSVDGESDSTPVTESDDETSPGDDVVPVTICRGDDGEVPCSTSPQSSVDHKQPLINPVMNGCCQTETAGSANCCSGSGATQGDCSPESTNPKLGVDDMQPLSNLVKTTNGCCHHSAVEETAGPESCCSGSGFSHGNGNTEKFPDHAVATSSGNGFMNNSPSSKLTPFKCYNCASLIGVCPRGKGKGIQLFKCHVSSDISTGGPLDNFRFHTLERVFSNELLSSAEEDSSYRYIIRDLESKLPLLQLVLMNPESWSCSGLCFDEQMLSGEAENTGSPAAKEMPLSRKQEDDAIGTISSQDGSITSLGNEKSQRVFLEPVMKVMFCDISSLSSERLSEVESWGKKNQSDDIYMLGSVVESLARSLQANQKLFPKSYAAFQQFHFSFLAR